jgi:hypothetical protein
MAMKMKWRNNIMVKSEKIYSIQSFCDEFLGFCPITYGDKGELRDLLDDNGYDNLWDYPLSEIDHIVENNLDVVLVDCTYIDDDIKQVPDYRWVEIPTEE